MSNPPTPNIPRLRALVDTIAAIPAGEFNMDVWAHRPDGSPEGGSCGTTACALGSYVLKNPECGLRLRKSLPDFLAKRGWSYFNVVDERGNEGFRAACGHFGLIADEANFLFYGSAKYTPGLRGEVGIIRGTGTEAYKCRVLKNIAAKVETIIARSHKEAGTP